MKTSKRGFLTFTSLILFLFISVACVNLSYIKSFKVKTINGNNKLLNEQNLLLIKGNILSYPSDGPINDMRINMAKAYILSTSKIISLDIKKDGYGVVFKNKNTIYKPKSSMTVPINIHYNLVEKSGLVKVNFQEYMGKSYSASIYNTDITASAKTRDLTLHRIEKYNKDYYCVFSYYKKKNNSNMLAFARVDRNKLTILSQVEDKIKYRWARYGIIAFDKFFIFDYSDEDGKFRPSIISYDFNSKKIERNYIEKTDPLYDVFERNPNNYEKTDNFSYIKYLPEKKSIVRVKNPNNSDNYHAYIVGIKDGRLILTEDIDTGISVGRKEKNIEHKGNKYVFINSCGANIFLNNDKLIFYTFNNSDLNNKEDYQQHLSLNPLKKILIYGLDTRKVDYEGIIMGGLADYGSEIYATKKMR